MVPYHHLNNLKFDYLKQNGFDGLISIEEGSGTGLEGVKTAVNFVKEMWGK